MKILYAIQGTGNGHVARALEIVPILKTLAETDVLISGTQSELDLPFQINYQLYGLGFIFGQKGGVDIIQTLKKARPLQFLREINELPVNKYDLVINDFEPVSAWAAKAKGIPCLGLSHQAAVLSEGAPLPKHKDWLGLTVLKNYAPVNFAYGFHFKSYNSKVFTPVIRKQIRDLTTSNYGHYTVYLPAYSDNAIIDILSQLQNTTWQVFSKHTKKQYQQGSITINPVNNEAFTQSLASCEGILCGAGFEAPAEAMYLGKKVLVIPMSNQFEQHCNAAGAEQLGAKVLPYLAVNQVPEILKWVNEKSAFEVNFPDQTEEICKLVLYNFKNNLDLSMNEFLLLK
ncbi:MAG: glycosyltransferase family protein [Flexibacteraceae bacterium]